MVTKETQEALAHLDCLDLRVIKDQLAGLDPKALMDLLGLPEKMELQDSLESRVKRVTQDCQELPDHPVKKASREIEACQDHLVQMEFKDLRVFKDERVHLVLKAILECQELEECLVILAYLDCLDFRYKVTDEVISP